MNPPYIGPLTKAIPVKLFLDMVPSSSEDVNRVFRGCFGWGSVYVFSCRFEEKQSLKRCGDVFFDILVTSTAALALGML